MSYDPEILDRLVGQDAFKNALTSIKENQPELDNVLEDVRLKDLPKIEKDQREFGNLIINYWKMKGFNMLDLLNDDGFFEQMNRIIEVSHNIQEARRRNMHMLASFYMELLSELFYQAAILYSIYPTEKIPTNLE